MDAPGPSPKVLLLDAIPNIKKLQQVGESDHQNRKDQNSTETKIDGKLANKTSKRQHLTKIAAQKVKDSKIKIVVSIVIVIPTIRPIVFMHALGMFVYVRRMGAERVVQSIWNIRTVLRTNIGQGTLIPKAGNAANHNASTTMR